MDLLVQLSELLKRVAPHALVNNVVMVVKGLELNCPMIALAGRPFLQGCAARVGQNSRRRILTHALRGSRKSILRGLVAEPAGWPHSTFKARAARGLYPPKCASERMSDMQAGEAVG
jgi:hypothetical protein